MHGNTCIYLPWAFVKVSCMLYTNIQITICWPHDEEAPHTHTHSWLTHSHEPEKVHVIEKENHTESCNDNGTLSDRSTDACARMLIYIFPNHIHITLCHCWCQLLYHLTIFSMRNTNCWCRWFVRLPSGNPQPFTWGRESENYSILCRNSNFASQVKCSLHRSHNLSELLSYDFRDLVRMKYKIQKNETVHLTTANR